jgi:hypothetical protein
MPERIKVFLAQTRKPVPPPVLSPSAIRPAAAKSMTERWAEYKRDEKKSSKENSGSAQV